MKKNKTSLYMGLLVLSILFFSAFCKEKEQDPMKNKGVGPVTSVELSETIQPEMAKEGKAVFEKYCASCHKLSEAYIGPPLAGITKRRSPEWIMNMILAPEEMLEKDPLAQKLLETYASRMVSLGLTEEDARSILEYLREQDSTKN